MTSLSVLLKKEMDLCVADLETSRTRYMEAYALLLFTDAIKAAAVACT